ncbi:hypothetical protein HYPSUDRAFT_585590 [Hypholoma sublateritium FD-334 SS-4]|uniref:Uncharacterized protein n=1 Tax=Hypholoma sublateritium (strain FD-334 SS-4) TaxID=945553 RepID=A0A0D2NX56_HYPSF|nr:hypothetical protein HYPSUDRAFT_585590 [Hypholoma sublateritium FD-334 SS-4]
MCVSPMHTPVFPHAIHSPLVSCCRLRTPTLSYATGSFPVHISPALHGRYRNRRAARNVHSARRVFRIRDALGAVLHHTRARAHTKTRPLPRPLSLSPTYFPVTTRRRRRLLSLGISSRQEMRGNTPHVHDPPGMKAVRCRRGAMGSSSGAQVIYSSSIASRRSARLSALHNPHRALAIS